MRRLLLCLVLVSVACGTDADEAQEPTPTDAPASTPSSEIEECEDRKPPAPEKVADQPKGKPDIEVPDGAPPCELVIQDIYEGTGAEAKDNDTVTAHYVGVSWSTGEEFDASWENTGEPATFPLAQVVRGWQEGIPGMKEGGRRRLIIPPDLGYGAAGRPPAIAPNETLIFVVDLVKVE